MRADRLFNALSLIWVTLIMLQVLRLDYGYLYLPILLMFIILNIIIIIRSGYFFFTSEFRKFKSLDILYTHDLYSCYDIFLWRSK